MMTPAQYWISGGSRGGGFGRSVSLDDGRNVNRSTSENTFVSYTGRAVAEWFGAGGGAGTCVDVARLGAFPLPFSGTPIARRNASCWFAPPPAFAAAFKLLSRTISGGLAASLCAITANGLAGWNPLRFL
jgi:hypothetical protein